MAEYTLSFTDKSEANSGWSSFYSYIPDYMVNMNNEFYTFKDGQLYIHNKPEGVRNNFYGQQYNTEIEFLSNEGPSEVKIFKTIEIEGDSKEWDVTVATDIESGHVNKADFENKEGFKYSYIRRNAIDEVKTELLSVQGIGNLLSIGNSPSPTTTTTTTAPTNTTTTTSTTTTTTTAAPLNGVTIENSTTENITSVTFRLISGTNESANYTFPIPAGQQVTIPPPSADYDRVSYTLENSEIYSQFFYKNHLYDGRNFVNFTGSGYTPGENITSSDILKIIARTDTSSTTGSVTTGSVSSIGSNSVVMTGTVIDPGQTPLGFKGYILRGFFVKQGTGDAFVYNNAGTGLSLNDDSSTFTTTITGLQPNTTYTGRSYLAYDSAGSFSYVYGNNVTFTTTA